MSIVTVIKKRNGDTVPFEVAKIETALKKAFIAVTKDDKQALASHIASLVEKELELEVMTREGYVPTVEHTQDLVEKHVMAAGFYDVAKAYIIYRYERSKDREKEKEENLEKLEENALMVVKRSGKREAFSEKKVKAFLTRLSHGFEKEVSVDNILKQLKLEVFDGMTTKEINKALVIIVRAMIEQDPAYSYLASRLLLRQIDEETIGVGHDFSKIDHDYREVFKKSIKKGVEKGLHDKRMLSFDLDRLSKALVRERDELFLFLGTQTLHERYLVRDVSDNKAIIENIQTFWMRVAMGVALAEEKEIMNDKAIEFYEVMSQLRFVPSSPTLFHAGTAHPQLSSCYLNTVGDSLESIFKVYADNAQLSKWAGGIGTNWSSVRGSGALVKKSGINSNGIVPFLKIANDVTVAINRSGRRRGATCVYLENWHYDVDEFLELRKNTGDDRRRTHDMDTALWVSDLFMKRAKEDGPWTLFSPDEVPDLTELYGASFEARYEHYEREAAAGKIKHFRTIKARDLWRKMITMLYETGHPWITWKDPSNVRSPQDHAGVVHNSNLCTEITLNNSLEETAVCNLGSINYQRLVRGGKFDVDLVASTVRTAVRMLDNVIDVNYYPTSEAKVSNFRHRPVGLGIMGFHDALYQLDINFDTDEAVQFADQSMELVSYHTILASAELARERGAYESYKGSKWDRGIFPIDTISLLAKERGQKIDVDLSVRLDWTPVRQAVKQYGMRNSNCLAMAPTATISNIVGSIPTIEPIYKNIYVKSNMNGDFIIVNPYLVSDLKKLGLWDFEMIGKLKYFDGSVRDIAEVPLALKDKYKEVFEIKPEWLIKSAAHRGKWIDQSQSLNIYFAGTSGKELASIYEYAWSLGLKTTYYLRTLGASQVEKSTVSTAEFGVTHKRSDKAEGQLAVSAGDVYQSTVSSHVAAPVASAYVKSPATAPTAIPVASGNHEGKHSLATGKEQPRAFKITALPEATCEGCQ